MKLPDKPSELLELALNDLEKIEKTRGYRVDMTCWHESTGGDCLVCMAGAVMANTLGRKRAVSCSPDNFHYDSQRKLWAIDRFRLGSVGKGMNDMGLELSKTLPAYMHITNYGIDPQKFKEDMRGLIEILKAAGY